MQYKPRIYLDNAATSWPKPTAVYEVVDDFQRRLGSSLGRGGYAEADEVSRFVQDTRTAVARLIGAESPDRILFTLNGTDSLNLALHGILKPGDHVVTSVVEHNSILRPLRHLESRYGVEVTRVDCNAFGVVSAEDFRTAIRPRTRLIALSHASNVTGALQPVTEIGKIAHEHGILFLLDAAQTLGHLPLSVSEIGVDLLAAPGHKSLLGPLGTGILYIRSGVEEFVECVRQGGTGSASSNDDQPTELPDKYESGTHNVLGILGLGAGIEYVERRGPDDIRRHAIELTDLLLAGLSDIPGIEAYGPKASIDRVGVVSISIANQDAPLVAKRFEEEFRVQVRGGFQCAALMHRALGTFEKQGTVRFSVGPFNTASDIARATEAARTIASYRPSSPAPLNCPCVSPVRQQDYGTDAATLILPAAREVASTTTAPHSATDVSTIPGMRELWSETLGDPRVCIAVLDGPVDLSHAAFNEGNLKVLGHTSAGPDAATEHGTHIASVIFGSHKSQIKGIAPHCSGVAIPIYRSRGDGTVEPCSQSRLARAINQAISFAKLQRAAALVINISGGQFSESGDAQSSLKQAIAKCDTQNILVVAAAGNEGCDCLHVPGALPTVLTVGAMSVHGAPLDFSNWGRKYGKQGVLAVGENILGASVSGLTTMNSGTSVAAPIVSGVAALLLSLQLKSQARPSASDVKRAIVTSAIGCDSQEAEDCRRLLAGRLSIIHAIEALKSGDLPTMTHHHITDASIETVDSPSRRSEETLARSQQQPLGESLVAPTAARPSNQVRSEVTPSSCGCVDQTAHYTPVFAIGRLAYDFESITIRQAMQRRMKEDGGLVQDSAAFMRHLFRLNRDGTGLADLNLHEASRFHWVLEYGRRPLYAIQPPLGPTAGDDLRSIAFDYMEQQGLADSQRKLLLGEKDTPLNAQTRPDYFAIAGHTTGDSVTLLETGHTVPVLIPEYDLTDSWNLDALLADACNKGICDEKNEGQTAQFRQILDLFHKLIEPVGDTSEKRAKNFVVSHAVLLAAHSVAASSQQTLVVRSLDVIGDVGGRYPQEEVILVKATFIDIANPKDIEYAIDYYVNVSQPKPYFESQSSLGFA